MNEHLRKIAEYIPGTEAYDLRKQALAERALANQVQFSDPTTGAIHDVAKTMGADEFSYEDYVRERMSKLPHGPGLDHTQVNWDLYSNRFQNEHELSRCRPADFFDSIDDRLREYLELPADGKVPLGASIRSFASNEVNEFVSKHRLVNAFFTPEMIEEAIAETPSIASEHTQVDGIDHWRFSTVNEYGETESITLVRGNEKPQTTTAPYLPVKYRAEYDPRAQDIVFLPKVSMDRHNGINNEMPLNGGTIGQRLMGALGVQAKRVHQPLEFRIDEEPMRFISLGGSDGTPDAYVGDHGATMGHIDTPPRILIELA